MEGLHFRGLHLYVITLQVSTGSFNLPIWLIPICRVGICVTPQSIHWGDFAAETCVQTESRPPQNKSCSHGLLDQLFSPSNLSALFVEFAQQWSHSILSEKKKNKPNLNSYWCPSVGREGDAIWTDGEALWGSVAQFYIMWITVLYYEIYFIRCIYLLFLYYVVFILCFFISVLVFCFVF